MTLKRNSFSGSDLRSATVNRELVARLTFGDSTLEGSITTLEATLRLLVEQFGAPTRDFQITSEDLRDDARIVQHKLAITRHLFGIRLGAQLTEIVESLSDQRTLWVAQSVRAALETAGAATYYSAKFQASKDDISALLKLVDRSLYKGRFEWESWMNARGQESRGQLETFLSSQKKRESQIAHDSTPSVMTFIDSLEESLLQSMTEPAKGAGKPTPMKGQVRAIYSQLCDFVHPSIGTWKTYGHTEPEAFKVVISSCSRLEGLQFLWFGIGECAATMSLLGFHALQRMETMRASIVR
jgi:hypothetical protein